MHEIGGRLLEKLINGDQGGYRGASLDCGQGHRAKFMGYRRKRVLTVLAAVEVERAYYYCAACGEGVAPKDDALDIEGTSFSPGVRRMMALVGGKESFDEGRHDLEELAGIMVQTKEVERVAEAIGRQVETMGKQERQAILSEKIVPMQSVATLYIEIDGTGVPMVSQALQGRAGKGETGLAKTREMKLGCVFTQSQLDEHGYAVREEASTTYVGSLEATQEFGVRIYTEAMRRGLLRAQKVIVLGDGAPWIWGIADSYFPGETQIVDLYHAREHLANLGKMLYGQGSPRAKAWTTARCADLDEDVERLLRAMRRLRPPAEAVKESVRKGIEYFHNNAPRMRYAEFHKQGLFVGSGVVEAGCKTIIGQRLKQSGMRWTVMGANAITALRCCKLSGRWGEFWEARATG